MWFVRSLFLVLLLMAWGTPASAAEDPSFNFTATEKDFDLYFPAYLANGFFTTMTSLHGTDATDSHMVGLMDYTTGDVSRLAAIPSWSEIDYSDGAAWLNQTPVSKQAFRDYRQTLNMYDASLETHYMWVNGENRSQIDARAFVSESDAHLAGVSLTITPDFDGTIRLRFTLRPHPAPEHRLLLDRMSMQELRNAMRGQITGPTNDPSGFGQPDRNKPSEATVVMPEDRTKAGRAAIWYAGETQTLFYGGDAGKYLLWIKGRTPNGSQWAEAAAVQLPANVKPANVELHQSAQLVELEVTLAVHKGTSYTFHKYVAGSREGWGEADDSVAQAKNARAQGMKSLFDRHASAWHDLWKSDIRVEGNDDIQRTIHSDMFTLFENATVDTHWAMQAMGMTPYYYGHVFWDSDSWDFPALLLLHPDRARTLANFRFHTLNEAKTRARNYGYAGAMYPWESDPDRGTEVMPRFLYQLSERENHVDGDIAIEEWQYYLASGDREWLRQAGYPVIHELAAFWKSRSTYNAQLNRYEIHHVTSPDEAYDDVSNDAFTNAVAQKALRCAISAAQVLGVPADPDWKVIADKMYIPFSDSEQRHLDFDVSTPHDKHTWMGSAISWLAYPPLDLKMSPEVRRNDFTFSIQALHELSPDSNDMLPVMLPTVAAELGDENEASKWLQASMGGFLKPPFNVRSETALNNATHILCVSSGYLENFIYGFTGLRMTDDGLTPVYPPLLPTGLKSLTLKSIVWRGKRMEIYVARDQTGQAKLSQRVPEP